MPAKSSLKHDAWLIDLVMEPSGIVQCYLFSYFLGVLAVNELLDLILTRQQDQESRVHT